MQKFSVDSNGYYGEFGGAFVPEILYKCVKDLENSYLRILESEKFKHEFEHCCATTSEDLRRSISRSNFQSVSDAKFTSSVKI